MADVTTAGAADYTAPTGAGLTPAFTIGQATTSFAIPLLPDAVLEGLEHFTVTISVSDTPTMTNGAASATENVANVFIEDKSGKFFKV